MKQLIDFSVLIIQPLDAKSAVDLFNSNINDVSSELCETQITDKLAVVYEKYFGFFY